MYSECQHQEVNSKYVMHFPGCRDSCTDYLQRNNRLVATMEAIESRESRTYIHYVKEKKILGQNLYSNEIVF